jgi:hypothetical protein
VDEIASFEGEHEETVRSSIYESIEQTVEKRHQLKKKQQEEKEEKKTKEVMKENAQKKKKEGAQKKPPKRQQTDSQSQYVKDITHSEKGSKGNFQEFKINDASSQIDDSKFSEEPSRDLASPTNSEKVILDKVKTQGSLPSKNNKVVTNQLKKHQEQKKKAEDAEGPQEFRIGDDLSADLTEGFESFDGRTKNEKQTKKEAHKRSKEQYKAKVKTYVENKQFERQEIEEDLGDDINPKEFVLGDSKSQATDFGFAEKEKILFSERDEKVEESDKSFAMKEHTAKEVEVEEEESEELEGYQMSQASEIINPKEFGIKDDLSKLDFQDFSQNSGSN